MLFHRGQGIGFRPYVFMVLLVPRGERGGNLVEGSVESRAKQISNAQNQQTQKVLFLLVPQVIGLDIVSEIF